MRNVPLYGGDRWLKFGRDYRIRQIKKHLEAMLGAFLLPV